VRTTIDLPDDIHELVRYLAASRGESLGATIAAVLENVIDTEDRVTHAVRGVQIDPKSGLLSVSGGPLRRAAEVRSLAYDE
jgi:plasmid stability protein